MNTTTSHSSPIWFIGCLLCLLWILPNEKLNTVTAQAPIPDHSIFLPIIINKPYPDIEVLENYSFSILPYSESLGTGYAEIVNHTPKWIVLKTVDINTYDANHNFIRTITIPIFTELSPALSTNDKTCIEVYFDKVLRSDPDTASIQFVQFHYEEKSHYYYTDISDDFSVMDSIIYQDNGAIEGNVRNNGTKTSDHVTVTGTYYNSAGKVAFCASTAISGFDPFGPGEVNAFSFTPRFFTENGNLTYRLQITADYESWRYPIDLK